MSCLADAPYDVVVFLLDDMRYDQLPLLAETQERLASHAVQMDRAYVTTPLCCPERASFLSGGWRPTETGVLHNDSPLGGAADFPDTESMPVRIQGAGVPTALFGKYLNHYEDLPPYVPPGWTSFASVEVKAPWNDFDYFYGGSSTSRVDAATGHWDGYVTDWQVSLGSQFLTDHGGKGLFLYVSFRAPHEPRTPAEQDKKAFAGQIYRERAWMEADVSDKPQWLQEIPLWSDGEIKSFDLDYRKNNASILAVDRAMAALIDHISAQGNLQRTVFIVTSDNGVQWGEHRLVGKDVGYEESVHMPLWISHPDLSPRVDSGLVAANLDLAATVQQLVGLPVEGQGQSLVPVLCGDAPSTRDAVVMESWNNGVPWAGLVSDEWKFLQTGINELELYHLTTDPFEEESLHQDPTQAGRLKDYAERTRQERGLAILDGTLPAAQVGVPYQFQLHTAGGSEPIHFSVPDPLPEGLTLSDSGLLSGTPRVAADYILGVHAEDSGLSPYSHLPHRHQAEVFLTVLPGKGGCNAADSSEGETARDSCGCSRHASSTLWLLLPFGGWGFSRRRKMPSDDPASAPPPR